MIVFWTLLAAAAASAFVQDLIPGEALYHVGWYNASAVATLVLAALRMRGLRPGSSRAASARSVAFAGAAIVSLTGVAAGLMGPDTHEVAGVPGSTVHDAQAGIAIAFPLHADPMPHRRYAGGVVLWETPRTVVDVRAADARGNAVTITQPTNGVFLSPVLLMQQKAPIAGMRVRVDSFAVPALHRSVHAVLFTAAQAAQLRTGLPPGVPAVLFAVSTDAGAPVPQGIGIVPSGQERAIGGMRLTATVRSYPAVVVAAAPYLPAMILGVTLLVAAAALSLRPHV